MTMCKTLLVLHYWSENGAAEKNCAPTISCEEQALSNSGQWARSRACLILPWHELCLPFCWECNKRPRFQPSGVFEASRILQTPDVAGRKSPRGLQSGSSTVSLVERKMLFVLGMLFPVAAVSSCGTAGLETKEANGSTSQRSKGLMGCFWLLQTPLDHLNQKAVYK